MVEEGSECGRVVAFDAMQSRLLAAGQLNSDKPRRDAQFNGDKDSVLGRHHGRLPDSSADACQSEHLAWAVSAVIASGTKSRSAFLAAIRADGRSRRWRSFFKSLDDALVLRRMARARAHMREAEALQEPSHMALVIVDTEAGRNDAQQVEPPPAHHAVGLPVRAGL